MAGSNGSAGRVWEKNEMVPFREEDDERMAGGLCPFAARG